MTLTRLFSGGHRIMVAVDEASVGRKSTFHQLFMHASCTIKIVKIKWVNRCKLLFRLGRSRG